MNLIHSLVGRRQFLIASIMTLASGKIARFFYPTLERSLARAADNPGTPLSKSLKGCVVYYSATGSTAKIAGAIHKGIKSVMDCDVAPVGKIDPETMGRYDFVAIGTPIWFFRETANVRLFISNMPPMTGKLCIVFCTHGTEPSGTFFSLSQPITKKAMTVIGWNDWYGDTTHYIHVVQPYITHGHPDEIDLQEAESFGRSMAERARRIFAGEKDLIPEIPGEDGDEKLWVRSGVGQSGGAGGGERGPEMESGGRMPWGDQGQVGEMPGSVPPGEVGPQEGNVLAGDPSQASGGRDNNMPMMAVSEEIPVIDTSKCVYPRCTACMDNCIVNAIDLSIVSPAIWVSGDKISIKNCVHCGFPLCQRSCSYDAIEYKGQRQEYAFDMTKCTYPKCTLCQDHCGMKSIDLTQTPPVRHKNCEGCDLCWSICPEDAISITNLDDRMSTASLIQMLTRVKATMPKFRQLIPDGEWGVKGKALENTNTPRVVLNEIDWPYEVNEH